MIIIASRLAVLDCGLVLMSYLTRNLGLADYGRYALAVLMVNWAGTTLTLASGGVLVRLVSGNHSDTGMPYPCFNFWRSQAAVWDFRFSW